MAKKTKKHVDNSTMIPFKKSTHEKKTKKGLSRRKFLQTATLVGGTALVGTVSDAEAYKEFAGWPDRYGMLTDLTACIGCRSCEKACNEANNLPAPEVSFDDASVYEETRRPTAESYTVVNRYENPDDPDRPVYRKVQCNHCNEPACASACPIHAYTKTKEGPVLYDPELCFGCRYCMIACPFNVPAYDYESALEPKIVKCVMCFDRIKEGKMPACAEVCPMGAVTFGKRDDLLKLAKDKIRKQPDRYIDHVYGEREAGGTGWLYIAGIPFEELGFPPDVPMRPPIEYTKGFLGAVPVVFTVWPALFGTIYAALKHRENAYNDKRHDQEREEEK